MLTTILVILVVLWLLGMVSSYTLGGFIHHVPADAAPTPEQHAEDVRRYGELLAFYEETFRETPPDDVWPPIEDVAAALTERDVAWQTSTFSCRAHLD